MLFAGAHLVVTLVGIPALQRLSPRLRSRRGAQSLYDHVTTALGVATCGALLWAVPASDLRYLGWRSAGDVLVAALAGMGFAMAAFMVNRRFRLLVDRDRPAREYVWCAVVATSEEMLWRAGVVAAVAALSGPTAATTLALAVAGFALLHRPLGGWGQVLLMAGFGTTAFVLTHLGGVAAAILFHVGYNVVLLTSQIRAAGSFTGR